MSACIVRGLFLAMLVLGLALSGMPAFADEPAEKPAEKKPAGSQIPSGTIAVERGVAASLNWLARHQNEDGSWSLDHKGRCKEQGCNGAGTAKSDSAATAFAVLCYLGAGQTQKSNGPYKKQIEKAIKWLIDHQKKNGDLSAGGSQMYSHGVATMALSEAYGITDDEALQAPAQLALDFIQTGQNKEGGWRYVHGSADSDMSVVGWQASALKSGELAELKVAPDAFTKLRNYLDISAKGENKDRFGYTPGSSPSIPMTTTGLLVSQYLGEGPDSPVISGGTKVLMANLPALNRRNCYYWYYGTRVMRQQPGENWDTWNRTIRKLLVESQDKEGCAAGSWDPNGDAWGQIGGRVMVTSLSCLALEVYYSYLPLHKRLPAKPEKEKPGDMPKAEEKKE